jgi:hypothetical protein
MPPETIGAACARSGEETHVSQSDLLRSDTHKLIGEMNAKADFGRAAELAEAMIPVNAGSKEAHVDAAARALLTACFMFAQIHPEKD